MNQNKMLQSGRSMVEILGVLAVAGVLSVGAVSGYKYGMNKYRTVQTINELQIRALGLMPQVSRGEIVELKMEMGDKTSLGYTTNAWINERDPKYFYISLESVPPEICEQILKEEWTLPTAIHVGDHEFLGYNTSICGNDTYSPPMDFGFSSDFVIDGEYIKGEDMGGHPLTRHIPQAECDTLEEPLGDTSGRCYACDYTGDVYVGERGVCSEICPNRQKSDNSCINKTCPSDKPLMDGYGNCYACDTTSNVYVGYNGPCSEICSNRIMTGSDHCRLTVCPSDKPLMDWNGDCRACNETNSINIPSGGKCAEVCPNRSLISQNSCAITTTCPADKPLMGTDGSCYACNTIGWVFVGERGQCESVCSNRQINGAYCYNKCPSDKPLMDNNGDCYACDTTDKVYVGSGQCSKICPNRQKGGNYCYNKTCPSDKPLMDYSGTCHACDTTSSVLVNSGECSEICSNRTRTSYGYCTLSCPSDKPLMDDPGYCHACDTTDTVYVYSGQCSEICPNRILLSGSSSRMCVLPCPADKPLMDYNGSCNACDEANPIGVGTNGKCSEICSNRVKTEDGYCALSCPSNKPLMHLTGQCYSCGMKSPIEVGINGKCEEVCANRTKKGELCYLNEEEEKEE